MKTLSTLVLFLASSALIASCASHSGSHNSQASSMASAPAPSANWGMVGAVNVEMKNAKGESIGSAWVAPAKEGDKGIVVQLDLHGLPEGTHGIHIHEKASCVGPDFKSAGGHFSPTKHDHGAKAKQGPHAGDLGNIKVGSDGMLQTRLYNDHVDLGVSLQSLQQGAGTSIIIHAKEDDEKSQPAGNSGDRIACGVIEASTK
ncbi:MAG: superoxide dismutase family protein [Bdellovibrionales bacterium]|nr:superoxide dismutase family protein [Oligoflexia bacterium]